MEHIGTLFPPGFLPELKTSRQRRGELVKWFADGINMTRGKPYKKLPLKFFHIHLSHMSLDELYALKSQCLDRGHRQGSWAKYWWWVTETVAVPEEHGT